MAYIHKYSQRQQRCAGLLTCQNDSAQERLETATIDAVLQSADVGPLEFALISDGDHMSLRENSLRRGFRFSINFRSLIASKIPRSASPFILPVWLNQKPRSFYPLIFMVLELYIPTRIGTPIGRRSQCIERLNSYSGSTNAGFEVLRSATFWPSHLAS